MTPIRESAGRECRCLSYNQPKPRQYVPSAILVSPFSGRRIAVDSCIADVIAALWRNGVKTGGSCCGHGRANPSVVLFGPRVDDAEFPRARASIAAVDSRDWDIGGWQPSGGDFTLRWNADNEELQHNRRVMAGRAIKET